MKRLYRVEITVMVMSETEDSAKDLAANNAQPEDCDVFEAKSSPSSWYSAIPFGADDDSTC